MANVNYNEGVPSVAPDVISGNDYSSVRATPDSFGGQIAQGEEKLGQGAFNSAQFFGKVAADDASNQFQDYATKLLHGDPNKSTPGPDGQPIPDTGYLGTRGSTSSDQPADGRQAERTQAESLDARTAARIRQLHPPLSVRCRRENWLACRRTGHDLVFVGQYRERKTRDGSYCQQFRR